ncbi:hypothetical protein IFT90_15530 [Frigoribacterium sp. CFBP 8766]|uniref:hypothetical protein n=1 Tax=Frigoribacterium sp. CFBP 8766 TaxID=2775273 RepID=UPI0017861FD3|nr:hypothetical protein [Frigoribacterium sp. CFBP 8766]MBD8585966.1 hypothetical protein [Frigoribacterium sp. CFBP 8766]
MSKSLIHHEHIRVLVWAGQQARFGGPLRWGHHDLQGEIVEQQVGAENAAGVGAMLVAQNEAVFDERHDWDDEHEPYEHTDPERQEWSAVEILKAIDHYLYHSLDDEASDTITAVDAAMYCHALRLGIVTADPRWDPATLTADLLMALPEYEAAPLEISPGATPAAGAPTKTRARKRALLSVQDTPTRRATVARQRTRTGRPGGPVPWMMSGMDGVWVWDPGKGLVRLDDPFGDGRNCREWLLSPDGRHVRYVASPRGMERVPTERRCLDLVSGEVAVEPDFPAKTQVHHGGPGLQARVHYTQLETYHATAAVTLERDGEIRELEPQFAVTLGLNYTGSPIQFSPDRRWAAMAFRSRSNPFSQLDVVDLSGKPFSGLSHYGLELRGSGSFSPSGIKLLVERTQQGRHLEQDMCVCDTLQQDTRPITVLPEHRTQAIEYLGWLDDTRLLAYVREKRRVSVLAVDPRSGEQEEIVNFGMPMNSGNFHGIWMAPGVVQADPATLQGGSA